MKENRFFRGLVNLLLAVIICTGLGCTVLIEDHSHSDCDSEVVGGGSAVDEIKAIIKQPFDDGKCELLTEIAKRKGLDAPSQLYLIKAVRRHLNFHNSREKVIIALIRNSSLTSKAKKSILDNIDMFQFVDSKQRIIKEISRHGPCIDESTVEQTVVI